jgi:hypothetical protein
MPTLVLSGEKAPAALQAAARNVAAALPNGAHRVLPRQSHNVSMKVLAPVIIETLTK